jgi:hypothetical protein
MVVKRLNDRIKNDTFESVEFEYNDNVGNPMDLTGVTVKVQFRNSSKKGHVVKSIDTTSGITMTDAVNGKFEIDKFTPVDFEVGNYYYDVETTFTNGDIKTYVGGTFKVIQDVTNG